MSRPFASILGTGRYLPAQVVTNADMMKKVDTTDEWIVSRTGIRERRLSADGEHSSDMGVKAATAALAKAGIRADELSAIICGTLTPDYPWPATACIIQEKLGARQAFAFDLSAACSGFIYGMAAAEGLIAAGTAKYVLVIGTEKLSSILDFQDRNTCVLFGDGAGAAVLGPANGRAQIKSMTLGANGSMVDKLLQPAGGTVCPITVDALDKRLNFLKMDGKEVFKFAVKIMGEASAEALRLAGLTSEDVKLFIPHQANIRIIESAAKFMGLPMERVIVNLDKYGNTSAASVGIALDEAVEQGRLQPGDNTVLVAFGAGLTWAACCVEW